ncbi:DNA-3-methyladenine glycosylase I [Thalassolituus sp. LLYu03]|uniref:DNA-3-methyladenine glycosylase I n=1 Tax=Thalassolituus sp. LLYu03 TaxID=3421656 RepID=UPI003D2E1885
MTLRPFAEIESLAFTRHGKDVVEQRLSRPQTAGAIAAQTDDRWLSELSRIVFQTGFNWTVVDNKWPAFEREFGGFNLAYCRQLSDEQLEDIMQRDGLIKHWAKIKSITDNAVYLSELVAVHGSVGAYFSNWQAADYGDNISALQKCGSRLGGKTAQIWLRRMGVDALIFSNDVIAGLKREGVVNSAPSSKKAWASVQQALDIWRQQSGRSLNEISQILALSVES